MKIADNRTTTTTETFVAFSLSRGIIDNKSNLYFILFATTTMCFALIALSRLNTKLIVAVVITKLALVISIKYTHTHYIYIFSTIPS